MSHSIYALWMQPPIDSCNAVTQETFLRTKISIVIIFREYIQQIQRWAVGAIKLVNAQVQKWRNWKSWIDAKAINNGSVHFLASFFEFIGFETDDDSFNFKWSTTLNLLMFDAPLIQQSAMVSFLSTKKLFTATIVSESPNRTFWTLMTTPQFSQFSKKYLCFAC